MGYWIRSLFCLVLVSASLSPSLGWAQGVDLAPISVSFSSSEPLSHHEAVRLFEKTQIIKGTTNFGFSEDFFWIRVSPPTEPESQYVLDVDNPHIDKIEVWSITDTGLLHLGLSGDRIRFADRTHTNRRNIFRFLAAADTTHLLILADKRNAAVSVPLKLWRAEGFEVADSRYNMYHGLYFGMLLLIILYSILIFGLQKQSVYLWYATYVAALFMYLFVHVGYGFQFLFPEQYEWSNYLRLIMMVTIIISQIRFTQKFIPVRSTAPVINRLFNFVTVALVAIILWWIAVPGLFTTYTIVVINTIFGFIGFSLVLVTLALIKTWNIDRTSSVFYVFAFGSNVLAAGVMMVEEFGLISLSGMPLGPLFIGSFFEIMIFAIGLSYRSRLIVDDRQKLLTNIGNLQNQALSAYLKGIEEEKGRISRELHDDIAARLGSIKLKMESTDPISEDMEGVIQGVRTLSHDLAPADLKTHDFVDQLQKTLADHSVKTDLQVFDIRNDLTSEQGLQLLRMVQEGLQNVRKHAEASHVDVQFFEHETAFVLTMEDNGKGFDMQTNARGIGIRNMKDRAESINAEFSISSAKNEGTSIMISVPKR